MLAFGRYQVLGKLSEGGMGLVYRGLAHGADGFQKPVVIKRIHGHLAHDPDMLFRFVNEAKLTMGMSHGNLVQVLDLGKLEDEYFMVLEYVDGQDLRSVLRRCKARGAQLDQSLALHVICQVLRGLDYAHRRSDASGRSLGIVHRDVKPGNILCSFEGEVKLTDFGVATAMARLRVTAHGMVVGSLAYMSPEQVRGGELDRRSDIFSVGVILYQLLCGAHPFPGSGIEEIGRAVQHARFLAPAAHGVELGDALEQVLIKSLQRQVEDRYQTAEAMLVDLESCQPTLGRAATASDVRLLMHRLFADELEHPATPLPTGSDALVGVELEVHAPAAADTVVSSYARSRGPLEGLPTASAVPASVPAKALNTVATISLRPAPSAAERSGSLTAVSRGELTRGDRPPRRWGALVGAGGALLGLLISGSIVALWSRPTATSGGREGTAGLTRVNPGGGVSARRSEVRPSDEAGGAAATAPRAPDSRMAATAARTLDRGATASRAPDRMAATGPHHSGRPTRRGTGVVQVSTQPAYADVYLGQRRLDVTPCRVRLPEGRHVLRLVNRKLHLEVRRSVTVKAGGEVRLMLDGFE